jgi:hypothetical protein
VLTHGVAQRVPGREIAAELQCAVGGRGLIELKAVCGRLHNLCKPPRPGADWVNSENSQPSPSNRPDLSSVSLTFKVSIGGPLVLSSVTITSPWPPALMVPLIGLGTAPEKVPLLKTTRLPVDRSKFIASGMFVTTLCALRSSVNWLGT